MPPAVSGDFTVRAAPGELSSEHTVNLVMAVVITVLAGGAGPAAGRHS